MMVVYDDPDRWLATGWRCLWWSSSVIGHRRTCTCCRPIVALDWRACPRQNWIDPSWSEVDIEDATCTRPGRAVRWVFLGDLDISAHVSQIAHIVHHLRLHLPTQFRRRVFTKPAKKTSVVATCNANLCTGSLWELYKALTHFTEI